VVTSLLPCLDSVQLGASSPGLSVSAATHIRCRSRARLDAESLKQLEKTLDGLETLVGDMAEFTLFLEGYPRISRQPYSTHLLAA